MQDCLCTACVADGERIEVEKEYNKLKRNKTMDDLDRRAESPSLDSRLLPPGAAADPLVVLPVVGLMFCGDKEVREKEPRSAGARENQDAT